MATENPEESSDLSAKGWTVGRWRQFYKEVFGDYLIPEEEAGSPKNSPKARVYEVRMFPHEENHQDKESKAP